MLTCIHEKSTERRATAHLVGFLDRKIYCHKLKALQTRYLFYLVLQPILNRCPIPRPSKKGPHQRYNEPQNPVPYERIRRARASHVVQKQIRFEIQNDAELPSFNPGNDAGRNGLGGHAFFGIVRALQNFAQFWFPLLLIHQSLCRDRAGVRTMHLDRLLCFIQQYLLAQCIC